MDDKIMSDAEMAFRNKAVDTAKNCSITGLGQLMATATIMGYLEQAHQVCRQILIHDKIIKDEQQPVSGQNSL